MAQESFFFMADTLVVWLELPDAFEGGVQVYICQGYGKIVYGWHGMGVDFMIPSFRPCLVSLHLIAYSTPSIPLQSASLRLNRRAASQGTYCGTSLMPREVAG
jgi:hypothetical protein